MSAKNNFLKILIFKRLKWAENILKYDLFLIDGTKKIEMYKKLDFFFPEVIEKAYALYVQHKGLLGRYYLLTKKIKFDFPDNPNSHFFAFHIFSKRDLWNYHHKNNQ